MVMDSCRLIFDSSAPVSAACHGNMIFLGNGDPVFRGVGGGGRGGGGGWSALGGVEENSNWKRRAFFSTTPEELMMLEDDHYDEQALLPEKKRRLTPEQVGMLERCFEEENKLEPEKKSELARKLGLQQRQVAVWFQNRRARWKTKELERDYDLLKSSHASLRAERDSLLQDNLALRSQVLSLTEKLQAKVDPAAGTTTGGGAIGTSKQPDHAVAASNTCNFAAGFVGPKAEDHLSTGSVGWSAVVDQESPHQLVDSGDSYFPEDMGSYNQECGGAIGAVNGGGVQSEEDDDDRSDIDGRGYFSGVFDGDQLPEEVGDLLGLWVWP